MSQHKSSIPFFEISQDGVKLNEIQTEPKLPTENESENRKWINFDEKYVKTEEVEICDYDAQGNLINPEFNLECVKFENISIDNDVADLIDTENLKGIIREELSSAFEQENNEGADLTSLDVKERLEDVHLQKICYSYPYYKVEGYNDAALSKHLSNEDSGKSPNKETYMKIDVCEAEKTNVATGRKTWVSSRKAAKLCTYTTKMPCRLRCNSSQVYSGIISFGCPHCDYTAKTKILLKRHMLKKHEDKSGMVKRRSKIMTGNETSVFKCILCSYRAKMASLIRKHFNQVHSEVRNFACARCDYAAKRKFHLIRHIRRKHESTKSKMASEKKTSIASRKAFKCTLCSYIAKTPRHVKYHFNEAHLEIQSFDCPHCNYTANAKILLKRHVLNEHKDKSSVVKIRMMNGHEMSLPPRKIFQCTLCSYRANMPCKIKRHFGQVHSEIRSFSCPHCKYAAKVKHALQKHIIRKHENKSGVLSLRSKVGSGRETSIDSRKGFQCTLCSYFAKDRCRIRNHFNQVHSEIRNFSCPHCKYAAKTKVLLKTHILNMHEDESGVARKRTKTAANKSSLVPKPAFMCTVCSFTAKWSSHVTAHFKQVHSEVRTFPCPHCDYAAKKRYNLNRHIQNKHEDKSGIVKNIAQELSSAFEKRNDKTLESVADITFVDVKECFKEINDSQPYYKSEAPSEAALPNHASDEYSVKSPDEEIYLRIDVREPEKYKIVTVNETSMEPKKAFNCTLCFYAAKTPSQVEKHFKQVHLGVRNFGCPHCDYAAKVKGTLNRHIFRKHKDKSEVVRTRQQICHICEKRFTTESVLKKHIESVHNNVIKKKCTECNYEANNNRALRGHITLAHHPENLFRCYNCEYTTAHKARLKDHIIRKHSRILKRDDFSEGECTDVDVET